MWKTPACRPYNGRTGRRAALHNWRFSAPPRDYVEDSARSQPALTHVSLFVLTFI